MSLASGTSAEARTIAVFSDEIRLTGDLTVPDGAQGIVLFAHGSGSSRLSPRNRLVAGRLNVARLATLLVDLLTPDEEAIDERTRALRFDIPLLAGRLQVCGEWLQGEATTRKLPVGYFGASTGAAAALIAAAQRPERVRAIVSRGGRADLAGDALPRVAAPTLLIVGADDLVVLDLNRQALESLSVEKRLAIVPGASHLFEEPGTLEQVADLARDWFLAHLRAGS
jgi:pimeloyl-ACP methyl ester carboxylesterase